MICQPQRLGSSAHIKDFATSKWGVGKRLLKGAAAARGGTTLDAKSFIQLVEKTFREGRRIESCGRSQAWHLSPSGKNPETGRIKAETCHCGKRLTSQHVRVAVKLAYFRADDPKHILLAKAASCSPGTVVRALERLRLLSLLSWAPRYLVVEGVSAFRLTNAYLLGEEKICKNLVLRSSPNLILPDPKRNQSLTQKCESILADAKPKRTLAQISADRHQQLMLDLAAGGAKRAEERDKWAVRRS